MATKNEPGNRAGAGTKITGKFATLIGKVGKSLWVCRRSLSRILDLAVSGALCALSFCAIEARAQDVLWVASSEPGLWNNPDNWFPKSVPGGLSTAIFGASTVTAIDFGTGGTVGTMQFQPGAPAYSFTLNQASSSPTFLFVDGIVNDSSNRPTFTNIGATLEFANASTAANAIINNNSGGTTEFADVSTSGNATITNSANLLYVDSSTMGSATITNTNGGMMEVSSNGGTTTSANITNNSGATLIFTSSADAGTAVIHNSGVTQFDQSATADKATITTASGGLTEFAGGSTGGTAQLITDAGGTVDISGLSAAVTGTTAGSIEGAGTYALGGKTLTVGSNNLSTVVSGTIADGGIDGGRGGTLVKVGTGKLTLTGTNTYSGGTSFNGGIVAVDSDLNLGSGPLSFNGGTLEALAAGGGITSTKAVTLNADGGTFSADPGTTSTLSGVISGSGSWTIAGGGRLILTGNNTYTGRTTISASTLQIGNGASVAAGIAGDVTDNGALVFDLVRANAIYGGTIIGSGSLTQNSPVSLILTAANTYSGGTTINNSTLQIGNGGTMGSIIGNVTLNGSGAALIFERSDSVTFAGVISGSGNLTQNGTGTLDLTGANTYMGGTTINAGTLQIGNGGTTGSIAGNVTMNNVGAVLVFDRSDSVTFGGAISGVGNLTQTGTGTLVLTGADTYVGGTTIRAGAVQIGNGGTTGSITGDVLDNASLVFDRSDSVTFNGSITGSGSLTKNGSGTLTLTAANTYSGGTNINAGTVAVPFDPSLGSGPLSFDGGTLEALPGNGTITSSKAVTLNAGGGTFLVDTNTTWVSGGVIGGVGSLSKAGQGTLILAGDNTYTGGTTISAGTLQVGTGTSGEGRIAGNVTDNGALVFDLLADTTYGGTISGTGSLTTKGAASLILTGANTYTGGTTISNGVLQIGNGGTSGSIAGDVTDNALLLIDRTGTLTLNGAISGIGSVTQQENAAASLTVILTGTDTYTGGTTIDNGVLQIGNGGTTGSIAGNVNINNVGAVLVFDRSDSVTFGGAISGVGNLTQNGAGTLVLTGADTYVGGTTISDGTVQIGNGGTAGSITGDVLDNASLVFDRSDSVTFDGSITGSGSLTQNGSGTLTLTAANTYSGGTNINAGAVAVPFDPSLGSGPLSFNGGTLEVLPGNGTITSSKAVTLNEGGGTFLVDTNTTWVSGGAIGGVGSLNKAGQGTLILAGANTYSGNTKVNAGSLLVDGSLGPGSVSVASGATLGGTGTIGGPVTILNGGILAPGAAPGTLTAGTLTLSPGSISNYQLSTPNVVGGVNDLVIVKGNLTLAGTLNIANAGAFGPGLYRLFDYTGSLTNDGLTLNNVPGGFTPADMQVQTTQAGEVNLLVLVSSFETQFWDGTNTIADGTIHGGNGTWDNGTTNWTNANATDNASWHNGFATFAGAAGTVILGSNIALVGMDFVTTGYTIKAAGNQTLVAAPTTILEVCQNVTATISVPIVDGSSPAKIDKVDSGTVILTAANTYTGGTTIGAGILQLGDSETPGSIVGAVINNGTFDIVNANTARITAITNNSGGQTDFENNTTAASAAITNNAGGTTSFSNMSTAGNATITTNNGGLTDFTGTSTGALARLITNAGGILDISGLSSSGMTAGSIEGAGAYRLGSKALTVGLNNLSTEVSGTIEGGSTSDGTLIKEGSGTLTLSGTNTYGGSTILNAGTLTVNSAQALGLGNVVVNGGIVTADPQPINVKGNYTQNAGGILQLQVAGANPGQYDSLNVGGNATLGGTLQLFSLGFHPQAGNQLTLVTTGGTITNRFAQFVDPFATGPGYNTVDLVYGLNSVVLEFLNLTLPVPPPSVVTIDFESFAQTPNQRAAANILDNIQLNPKAADLMSFLYKEPVSNLPADLDKISPDGLTAFYEISFSNANIQRLNLEGRLDDVRAGSNGFSSNMTVNSATVNLEDKAPVEGKSTPVQQAMQPGPENRWGVWVTGFGDFVSVDSDYNARGYDFTTGGVSVGIDYRLTDQLAVGVMGEYAHTWTSLNPRGQIDVDSGRGGLYASWFSHGLYLNGAMYAGHNVYDSSRASLQGFATGGTGGTEFSTFVGVGYDCHIAQLTVGPVAVLQYTYAGIDDFTEKGSLAPLEIHSQSAESLRTDFGFRASYPLQLDKVLVEPSLRAAWEHEYRYTDLPITAGFAGIPGPGGTFTGPSEGHDSAVVSAGVTVYWTPSIATYLNYDGQLGRDHYGSNAVTGGVKIGF
jgi:autotransporter-associated beta strand protein